MMFTLGVGLILTLVATHSGSIGSLVADSEAPSGSRTTVRGTAGNNSSTASTDIHADDSSTPPVPIDRSATLDQAEKDLELIAARYPGLGISLSVDSAALTEQNSHIWRLTQRCMERVGFEFEVAADEPSSSGDLEPPGRASEASKFNEAYFASLTPDRQSEYNRSLYGVADPDTAEDTGDGGCLGRSSKAVGDLLPDRSMLAAEVTATRERSKVNLTYSRWNRCVHNAGLSDSLKPSDLASAVQNNDQYRAIMAQCPPNPDNLIDYLKAFETLLADSIATHQAEFEAYSLAVDRARSAAENLPTP